MTSVLKGYQARAAIIRAAKERAASSEPAPTATPVAKAKAPRKDLKSVWANAFKKARENPL